jgi:hypothetical protein
MKWVFAPGHVAVTLATLFSFGGAPPVPCRRDDLVAFLLTL